jgi:hypothetical protein
MWITMWKTCGEALGAPRVEVGKGRARWEGQELAAFAYKAHLSSIRLLIAPVEHLAGSLACARACR